MCGVFGIRAPERDVARVTYFGLFALQHRGQESAGIAVSDEGRLTVLRDMGLHGDVAIGHTRYSTTGSTQWANAQPLIQRGRGRTVALGHNGNLVNAAALRAELAAEGITLGTTSDTEMIAALIANDPAPIEDAVANAMARLEGAFSVVMLSEGKLIGFRDRHGFRPLCLGRGEDGEWILASETCALDLVGAELERELAPGELVTIDETATPIPLLAAKWDVLDNGLTYRFELRKGVHFHTGKEMTSADVKASLERFGRVSPEKQTMAQVAGVEAKARAA